MTAAMYKHNGRPLKIAKDKKKGSKTDYLDAAEKAAEGGNDTMARKYLSAAFTSYIKEGNTDLESMRKKIEEIEKKFKLR